MARSLQHRRVAWMHDFRDSPTRRSSHSTNPEVERRRPRRDTAPPNFRASIPNQPVPLYLCGAAVFHEVQGGSVNSKVDLRIKNWKGRSRSWELPFGFQIHHVQSILGSQGKPLFERCRRESKWKPHKTRKFDFGSLFEKRWGRFQLFLTEEWSSALERPCVWLSFPSLGGFWDPNLTSWRSFAVRLRFFTHVQFPCILRFSFDFSTASPE